MATSPEIQAAIARAKQLVEAAKARKLAAIAATESAVGMQRAVPLGVSAPAPLSSLSVIAQAAGGVSGATQLHWNEEQQTAIDYGFYKKSFVLIGAAGTGKTTTLKGTLTNMLHHNVLPPLETSTKHLDAGSPGVALISFTRRAVRNIAKQMPDDLKKHCITFHKLVEYGPEYYMEWSEEKKEHVSKMRFVPFRHAGNPLPRNLQLIVIDESSMFSTDYFAQLWAALPNPHQVQFIFLGDLNQLPPVYGIPILAKKLSELPIVELTRVYRQALQSPIVSLALAVKDNNFAEFNRKAQADWNAPFGFSVTGLKEKITLDGGADGKVTIHPWKKRIDGDDAAFVLAGQLRAWWKDGNYDPDEDLILCPWNKTSEVAFGVKELNLAVADFRSKSLGLKVHEVIAGFNKYYLAVGDKLMIDKQEAIVLDIQRNPRYLGKMPQPASTTLDRYGNGGGEVSLLDEELSDEQIEMMLLHASDVVDRTTDCSHSIKVRFVDSELEETLSKSAELNAGTNCADIFAYATTVHKAQGSECRRVFLLTHAGHAAMCSRELIYTAITRAREELYVLCDPGMLSSAAKKPRIKGDTLADKIAFFNSRLEEKVE